MILGKRILVALYLIAALATGIAVVAKAELVQGITGLPFAAVTVLLGLASLLPFAYRYFLRYAKFIGPAALGAMILATVFVQPWFSSVREGGRGSDQGECLAVGVGRMTNGQWPYEAAEMSTGNAMSCGPGWLILHLPVAVVGYPVTMALLLAAASVVLVRMVGRATVYSFMTLLALTPGFWLSLANGNDFLTFGFWVVALIALAGSTSRWVQWSLIPLSVVTAHFRFPFLALGYPLMSGVGRTRRRSMLLASTSVAASLALWFGFMAWNSGSYLSDGPMHVLTKFSRMVGFALPMGLFVAMFVLVSVVVGALASRFVFPHSVLVFNTLVVVPLAALNFREVSAQRSSLYETLAYWEGTSWMTALTVIAAFVLIISRANFVPTQHVSVADTPAKRSAKKLTAGEGSTA